MLQTAEQIRPDKGHIAGALDANDGWSSLPLEPTTRQIRIFLGDPLSGPLVWLFNGAPVKREDGATQTKLYAHLHHTPTFRMALGERAQQLLLNNRWYGTGEYFLLDANRRYSDPHSLEGYQQLLVFADRRGLNPTSKDNVGQDCDQLLARNNRLFGPFGSGLTRLHTRDEDAIAGAALSTREHMDHGSKASGSIFDQADWAMLSDGSRVAGAFMGDAAAGPAVIMTENAPNTAEPDGTCGADMFRLLVRGSCRVGERTLVRGDFIASEAGSRLERITHGPAGSTQLLVVSDRRFWAPVAAGALVEDARVREIADTLRAHIGPPAAS